MNCRYCGAQNDGDAIFCGQCGFQLIDDETVVHSPYDTLDTSAPTVANTVLASNELRSNELVKRGNELMGSAKNEEALSVFDEALRLDPNNAFAHYVRGIVLKSLKRYREALSAFDEALRLNPNDEYAKIQYSNTLGSFARHREALSEHELEDELIRFVLRMRQVDPSSTEEINDLLRKLRREQEKK